MVHGQPNWLTQCSSTLAGGAAALALYTLFLPCLLDLQTSSLEGPLCLWKRADQTFKTQLRFGCFACTACHIMSISHPSMLYQGDGQEMLLTQSAAYSFCHAQLPVTPWYQHLKRSLLCQPETACIQGLDCLQVPCNTRQGGSELVVPGPSTAVCGPQFAHFHC